MGTAGTALFSDDVACDVRDEFAQMLSAGVGEKVATRVLVHSRAAAIDDVDDGPVFWLALAATQWKYGCLSKQVQAKGACPEFCVRGIA